jgi:predicted ester cyclase
MESTLRENAALVRAFLTGVIAGGDTDALGTSLTDDALNYQPILGERRDGNTVRPTQWYVLAAADIDISVDEVVTENDQVAVRGTVTGTHRESLLDLVPTGRSFEIACMWFCRVENGRIKEIRPLPDGLDLVQQFDSILEKSSTPSSIHPTERQQP